MKISTGFILWCGSCLAAASYCHAGVSIEPARISGCFGASSTFGIYSGDADGFSLVCHTPNSPSAWGSDGYPFSWMTQLTSSDTLDGIPLPSSITLYTTSGDSGNDYQAATGVYGGNHWWTRVTYNNSLQAVGSVFGQVISSPPDAKVESTALGGGVELYTIYAKPISRIEGWQNLPLGIHRFQRTVSASLRSGVFYKSQYLSSYGGNYSLTFTQILTVSRVCNISPNSTVLHFGAVSLGQTVQLPLDVNIECDYAVTNDKQIAIQFSLSGDISKENNEISIYKVSSSGQKEEVDFNKDIPSLAERANFLIELSPNRKSLMGDKVASLNITITNV